MDAAALFGSVNRRFSVSELVCIPAVESRARDDDACCTKGGRCDDHEHYMLQGMCLKCTPYVEYLLSIAGTLVIVVREHSRLALPLLSNLASLCAWSIGQPPAVLELVHACKRMHHAHERPRSKHAKGVGHDSCPSAVSLSHIRAGQ